MKKLTDNWGGSRVKSGRKSDKDTAVDNLITTNFMKAENNNQNIFYAPIMNSKAKDNYIKGVINKKSSDGNTTKLILEKTINVKQDFGIWGLNDGKNKGMNKAQFEKIKENDFILFIGKEDEFQCICAVGVVDSTVINTEIPKKFFGNEEYCNIILIKKLIKFREPFKLSKKRQSVAYLEGVPNCIWHDSYDMMRKWNFYEKINKNKYSNFKILDEAIFIELLLKEYKGDIIYNIEDKKNGLYTLNNIDILDDEVAVSKDSEYDAIDIFNINVDELINCNINIKEEDKNTSLNNTTMRKPPRGDNGENENKLPLKQRMHIGWLGEKLIFETLKNNDVEFLAKLKIENSEKFSVNWFNENVNINDEWNDLSKGNGCDLILNCDKRTFYLEIKTSYNKGYLVNITGNEIRKASNFRDNYFLIIIDDLKKYKKGTVNITIIQDPIKNILENLINKTKTITMYR